MTKKIASPPTDRITPLEYCAEIGISQSTLHHWYNKGILKRKKTKGISVDKLYLENEDLEEGMRQISKRVNQRVMKLEEGKFVNENLSIKRSFNDTVNFFTEEKYGNYAKELRIYGIGKIAEFYDDDIKDIGIYFRLKYGCSSNTIYKLRKEFKEFILNNTKDSND